MKWLKYIGGIVIIFAAVAVSISGAVATFINIVEPNLIEIIAGVLTVAIGLYVGRIGLRLLRQDKFKFW